MKRFLPLVVLPLCLSPLLFSPGQARAEELPYSELIAKAENYLIPDEKKIVYEGAAIVLFHRAAKAAPDEGKKLEALLRAGYAEELMKQYPSAIESYEKAVALQTPLPSQKQRAQLALALAKFQLTKQNNSLHSQANDELATNLEAILQQGELPAATQLKARETIAEIHTKRTRPLAAVAEYQKLLALPALTPEARLSYVSLALVQLYNTPPSPEALALLNKLAAQNLTLLTKQADIALAQARWANALELQNAFPAALAKWTQITNDTSMTAGQRSGALSRLVELHRKQKNYPAALAAADRWPSLDSSPSGYFLKSQERAKIFQGQKNEPNARAEWQAFIALPQAAALDKAKAWQEIAAAFKRERVSSPADTTLLEGEKNAYLALWKLEGAKLNDRSDAVLNAAQMDVDAKQTEAAAQLLQSSLTELEAFPIGDSEKHNLQRTLYYALTQIYRSTQQNTKALAALIMAQSRSQQGDQLMSDLAITLFQDSLASKQWPEARNNLLALRNVWGLTPKQYFYNLAQIEIKAQDWPAAKTALDEFDKQTPSAAEKKDADLLRAMLPN